MPLPMVHLSIAHRLARAYGYSSSPAFYLGSIAPDAIHMRAGTGRADKLAVHLVGKDGIDLDRVQALVARDGPGDGLATGYAAHVLTDVYWRETVILPFRARHEERLSRGEMAVDDLRALYYVECDQVDIELYDRAPWRPQVWELLRSARARDMDGLLAGAELPGAALAGAALPGAALASAALASAALAAHEIERWRDRVLPWFEINRHKADYAPRYLTLERVLAFIDEATTRVRAQLAPA